MTVQRFVVFAFGFLPPLLGGATSDLYSPKPFEHYQPILDRMPFGALPLDFGKAAAEPSKTDAQILEDQKKLAKQINMSCINVTPGGKTAIGFTDLNEKPPQNYYLLVGDSGGGWTVVNADYDEEWAQIEKEGVTITLKLGKGLIDAPPAGATVAAPAGKPLAPIPPPPEAQPAPPAVAEGAPPEPAVKPGIVKAPALAGRPSLDFSGLKRARQETEQIRADMEKVQSEGGDVVSYMERLRARREQEKAQAAAVDQSTHEKLRELAVQIASEELKKREMNQALMEQGIAPAPEEAAPAPAVEDAVQ